MNIKKHIAEINRNGFSKIENVFTKKECEEYIKKSEKLFQFLLKKKQTKELLDACNLEWSNKCIKFNKNIRPVRTASSLQVRKSLYKDSVNSWKNYKKHLKPLIEILN